MPRMRRVAVPNYPHHIQQRGHNGETVFNDEEDCRKYLSDIQDLKSKFKVDIYAWCLLPDQVHLLANPGSNADMLAETMKGLSARTTRHRNRKYKRSGTLWEGRYRSSVVQRGEWTLACMYYLETLHSRMHGKITEHFPWTSLDMRAGRTEENWLDLPDEFQSLGHSPLERINIYTRNLQKSIDENQARVIESAVSRNQLTGDSHFIDEVERLTGIRMSSRGRGRPPLKREHEN